MSEIGTLYGRPIGQDWKDLAVWEEALNNYPIKLNWILELGTFEGGMSIFLHGQCFSREMSFMTVDTKYPEKVVPGFVHWDVKLGIPDFVDYFHDYPGVVFCDNGDKPWEVNHYRKVIHKESLIAVHDWGTEFLGSDIPEDYRIWLESINTIFLARNDILNDIESGVISRKD